MQENRSALNQFLVDIFNEILRIEEQYLAKNFSNLSVREAHVIEAVCTAQQKGRENRANEIAKTLRITPGTLTTSIGFLEKKGYLARQRDEKDKRVVRIIATDLGKKANELHQHFHQELVDDVLRILTQEEQVIFIRALSEVTSFFRTKEK